MTVTVTNMMPATAAGGLNTTYMYRKRPRRQHDLCRRVSIPVLGLLLATVIVLWFVLGDDSSE
jgi:hypothetical protein